MTVECNPEDVDTARLAAYRAAGRHPDLLGAAVDRAHVLGALGRRHGGTEAPGAADMIVDAGFASWNVDLIFGAAPRTTTTGAAASATSCPGPRRRRTSAPTRSTVEPGTPLGAARRVAILTTTSQARRYAITEEALAASGYRWEEISNWARPGHGCRHNQLYWRQGDYLGIGSAAHSHRDGHRWWNVRTPERYVDAISSGRSPIAGEEHLTADQRWFERLALALRTPAGVPAACLPGPDEAPELGPLVEVAGTGPC